MNSTNTAADVRDTKAHPGNWPEASLMLEWHVLQTVLLAVAILWIGISGCKVSLVPAFDSSIEDQIIKAAKLNDRIYLEIKEENPANRNYSKYSSKYLDVEAEINSLLLKDQARTHGHDLVVIINNVKLLFTQFKEKHKLDNNMVDADIQLNQVQIAAAWRALLVAERGLRSADN